MHNVLAGILVFLILMAEIFPRQTGRAAHEWYDQFKIGWDSQR